MKWFVAMASSWPYNTQHSQWCLLHQLYHFNQYATQHKTSLYSYIWHIDIMFWIWKKNIVYITLSCLCCSICEFINTILLWLRFLCLFSFIVSIYFVSDSMATHFYLVDLLGLHCPRPLPMASFESYNTQQWDYSHSIYAPRELCWYYLVNMLTFHIPCKGSSLFQFVPHLAPQNEYIYGQ